MKTARFILMALLGLLSLASVPAGILFGTLGLTGGLMDDSYEHNFRGGVKLLAIGFTPAVLLALSAYLGRSPKRSQGFPIDLKCRRLGLEMRQTLDYRPGSSDRRRWMPRLYPLFMIVLTLFWLVGLHMGLVSSILVSLLTGRYVPTRPVLKAWFINNVGWIGALMFYNFVVGSRPPRKEDLLMGIIVLTVGCTIVSQLTWLTRPKADVPAEERLS